MRLLMRWVFLTQSHADRCQQVLHLYTHPHHSVLGVCTATYSVHAR